MLPSDVCLEDEELRLANHREFAFSHHSTSSRLILEATSASSVGVSELAGYLGSFKKQYALPPWLLNAKYECHICPYNIKVGEGQILHSRDAAPRTTKLLCRSCLCISSNFITETGWSIRDTWQDRLEDE